MSAMADQIPQLRACTRRFRHFIDVRHTVGAKPVQDTGEKVIINIKTFADGHRAPDRVLLSMP
jgi:hypothetical protein